MLHKEQRAVAPLHFDGIYDNFLFLFSPSLFLFLLPPSCSISEIVFARDAAHFCLLSSYISRFKFSRECKSIYEKCVVLARQSAFCGFHPLYLSAIPRYWDANVERHFVRRASLSALTVPLGPELVRIPKWRILGKRTSIDRARYRGSMCNAGSDEKEDWLETEFGIFRRRKKTRRFGGKTFVDKRKRLATSFCSHAYIFSLSFSCIQFSMGNYARNLQSKFSLSSFVTTPQGRCCRLETKTHQFNFGEKGPNCPC